MAAITFDSAVARMLNQRIEQAIKEVGEDLAVGSCVRKSIEETALSYTEQMGVVRGLKAAQSYISEVEDDLQGRTPQKQGRMPAGHE